MADEEPDYDVAVNVMKGPEGYGIYFTCRDSEIVVTKLDPNSEAQRAGVQANDKLVSVMDLDKIQPPDNPGARVVVSAENYQQALQYVRAMKHCRLEFRAPAPFGGGF